MNVDRPLDDLWLDTASLLSLGNMRNARRALDAGALRQRLRWCETVEDELRHLQMKRRPPPGAREAMGMRSHLGAVQAPSEAQEDQIRRIHRQLATGSEPDKHWGEIETAVLAVDSHTDLADQHPDREIVVLAASEDNDMPVALGIAQQTAAVRYWTTVDLLMYLVASGHLTCEQAWDDYQYAISEGDRPLQQVTKKQLCAGSPDPTS